jgi:hypothetical protein
MVQGKMSNEKQKMRTAGFRILLVVFHWLSCSARFDFVEPEREGLASSGFPGRQEPLGGNLVPQGMLLHRPGITFDPLRPGGIFGKSVAGTWPAIDHAIVIQPGDIGVTLKKFVVHCMSGEWGVGSGGKIVESVKWGVFA